MKKNFKNIFWKMRGKLMLLILKEADKIYKKITQIVNVNKKFLIKISESDTLVVFFHQLELKILIIKNKKSIW